MPTNDGTTIGDRLAEVRKDAGLKQGDMEEELPESVEASRGTVSNYETGREPKLSYVMAVARRFDVSPLWLLAREGPKRWSDVRDSGWMEGAERVGEEVYEALRRVLPPHILDKLIGEAESPGNLGEEVVDPDITVDPNGDTGE